jgi:uncharacterized pyridoxal phosphate-containing UPF0001 family protein
MQPASVARLAVEAGLGALGENYAGELVHKAADLADLDVEWHFLGSIQTNKLARLLPVVSCLQGVSREKEATAIAARRPGCPIMVQVDVTGAPGRGGAQPVEVVGLVARARALGLDVRGLMTVAPIETTAARAAFRLVRTMADDLGLEERSMGMTDDLELAVEEGSTLVRVGRALFGARPPRS